MTSVPNRFVRNEIISLTSEPVRYDLAESVGPDLELSSLFDDAFRETLMNLKLSYGPVEGDNVLRQLIAERNGVSSNDVITTVGGMQALFLTAFILCDAGDEVVIGRPTFPGARTVLDSVKANIIDFPMSFDAGYRVDVAALRTLLTPRTRLVSLISPHNPSGVSMSEDEVRAILAAMTLHCPDAFLLIDETYREAAYGDAATNPSLSRLDPRIISCASLSKCHGAPGLRTGWLIARNPDLLEQMRLGKFNTTVCNSLVDDALAIRVLQKSDEILNERRTHFQEGLDRTAAFVDAHADVLEWVRPDAGALCCLRLKRSVFDEAAVTRFYSELQNREVRVGQGAWFGEEDRVFRIGFGLLSMADLDEALKRVKVSISRVLEFAVV